MKFQQCYFFGYPGYADRSVPYHMSHADWKGWRRKCSWLLLKYYRGICVDGLIKNTINLSHDRRPMEEILTGTSRVRSRSADHYTATSGHIFIDRRPLSLYECRYTSLWHVYRIQFCRHNTSNWLSLTIIGFSSGEGIRKVWFAFERPLFESQPLKNTVTSSVSY